MTSSKTGRREPAKAGTRPRHSLFLYSVRLKTRKRRLAFARALVTSAACSLPPCGGEVERGVAQTIQYGATPSPNPSPQEGGEFARAMRDFRVFMRSAYISGCGNIARAARKARKIGLAPSFSRRAIMMVKRKSLSFPSRTDRRKTSPPRSNSRRPSNNISALTPNARGSSSRKAICSTGPAPICAASVIVTIAPSPTAFCRRDSSPKCAAGFSISKPAPGRGAFSARNNDTWLTQPPMRFRSYHFR